MSNTLNPPQEGFIMFDVLKIHSNVYDVIMELNRSDRAMYQSIIDDLRRRSNNRNTDLKPYIYYIRQLSGEFSVIDGYVRSTERRENRGRKGTN